MPEHNPEHSAASSPSGRENQILGLSTEQLAGLSIDELTGNKTAITMVIHYYRILLDENTALRNDRNTLQTYVEGYRTKKTLAAVGAVLLLVANIGIGFGVNLLTARQTAPGLATLIPGLCFAIAGTYLSLKER
jgi:hypothetical protein